jgi:hypothetical protein
MTLRKALSDPALLGNQLQGDSWKPWRVLLIAAMGESLNDDERVLFKELTGGRDREPLQRVEELVGVIGRRGGKSRAISVLATYLSGLCNYDHVLVPGERGVCLVIAPDQNQADICLGYIGATFEASPILRQLIQSRTQRTLRLTNKIDIEVRAADFRRLRGPTFIAVIADESAFWLSSENSSNPDTEILSAVRPGLATTGGPLIMISSPYARKGELWRTYQKHFGPKGDPLILVAQGASRTFNPTLPGSVVTRALERDEAAARAEYLAEFRRDIEAFVSLEAVQACVSKGIFERPYDPAKSYLAFVDPSGGSADSFTLAIGHHDVARQTVVVDCLREAKPPFSPEAVVEDFCRTLKDYRVTTVVGDRYAGEWPREQFSKLGITYQPSTESKSVLYAGLVPLINSSRISLLDNAKTVSQLVGLERRVARGGRDSIDHAPGAHDDLANVVAGLASLANRFGGYDLSYRWVGDDTQDDVALAAREQRRKRIEAIMRGEAFEGEQAHATLSNADLARYARPLGLGILR